MANALVPFYNDVHTVQQHTAEYINGTLIFVRSFVHSFIHSFICPFVRSFMSSIPFHTIPHCLNEFIYTIFVVGNSDRTLTDSDFQINRMK